jgi:hypothetical protein
MRSQFRSSGTITPRLEEIYLEKDRCLKTRNITKRPLITEFQRKIFDVSSVKKKFHPYITKK